MVLIVDPAYLPEEIKEIREYAESLAVNKPMYVLFTHSDFDHIPGYGSFPNGTFIASESFTRHPDPAEMVTIINTEDDKLYLKRPYPIEYPSINIVISVDGQKLAIGTTELTFYLAPGHNRDGIFTVIEPLGILITGDYLSELEFPFVYHSFQDYFNTLNKVEPIYQKHYIRLMIPGHGTTCDNRDATIKRIKESEHYLAIIMQERKVSNKTSIGAILAQFGYGFPTFMEKKHIDNLNLLEKEFN
jgi:glyoxylase-like metal-dependent hydrolase (beta-lactamase superfamily II)